jgi:hypothetical protein
MQPGGEFPAALIPVQIAPDTEPDFLADVAGVVLMADDAVDKAVNITVVRRHQDAEGHFISLPGAAKQCDLVSRLERGGGFHRGIWTTDCRGLFRAWQVEVF